MAKYNKQKCIHCLSYHEELTEDHVFPRSWYPDSTPANIEKWTIPSCYDCNNKLGQIEEDIFWRLAICVDENDFESSGISKKIINRLMKEPKNKRELGRRNKLFWDAIKNFVPYLYDNGNNRVLKNSTPKTGVRSRRMIRIPGEKLYLLCQKIIKGLEFKLRNRLVEGDREICIITPHANNIEELEIVNNWEKLISPSPNCVEIGPGFVIKYRTNIFDNDWVIYNILIWNHLEIWAMIHPKDRITKNLV